MSRKLRHRSHHGQHEGEHPEPPRDRHEEVQLLAHQLWEKRGKPLGSPEEDWFKAEAQLEAATRL